MIARNNCDGKWVHTTFLHYDEKSHLPYKTTNGSYRYTVPYNDETKHLIGDTKEAPDKYIKW